MNEKHTNGKEPMTKKEDTDEAERKRKNELKNEQILSLWTLLRKPIDDI